MENIEEAIIQAEIVPDYFIFGIASSKDIQILKNKLFSILCHLTQCIKFFIIITLEIVQKGVFFLNLHRNTFVLFIVILLNGCLSNQMLQNELSEYRATIISSRIPQKIGALTLVQAKSDVNNISLIFTKNKFVDMDSLVERVAIEFCEKEETRYLLKRGISYRIITLDYGNKIDSINSISLKTCINDK